MTKQVIWTKKILDTFILEGNLNDRQIEILKARVRGDSIVKQSYDLHLSIDQINKEIFRLKKLYDETQKYSEILPPRKKNSTELYERSKKHYSNDDTQINS